MVAADVFALELSVALGALLRILLSRFFPNDIGTAQYLPLALGVLPVCAMFFWLGVYPGYRLGVVARLRARIYTTVAVFTCLLAWNYIFEESQWSRGVLLCTAAFALVLPSLIEAVVRSYLLRSGVCGVPVVILGAGDTGSLVARNMLQYRDVGLVPIGMLDDDSDLWGSHIHGVPVVGPLSRIDEFQGVAETAVVAMPGMDRAGMAKLITRLSFPNIIVVPNLFGQTLWITSRDLGGVLGLEVRKNLLVRSNRIMKRALDYLFTIPIALVSLPIIGIFALWIRIVSPGNPFFRQDREGFGGGTISILKLRTMYPDSESVLQRYLDEHPSEREIWQRFYKLKKDPRILPGVGWFLRRFSLDELPQVWNILRGEMSLVGPRPFPGYHIREFPAEFRAFRASVMPGLTGLWQVSGRSDSDLSEQEAIDTYYIRNWSLWLDFYILLRTVQTVLAGRGAY